jgi:OOP family OmpA-OmpF porin
MLTRKLHTTLRTVARATASAGLLSAVACGGQMPFSGNVNVAGDPPPLPPPKEEEPPKPPPRVEVRDNKIEIREKIHFETAKAVIKEDSFSLMDEIVQVFKDNPHIQKVSIEGHTDSDGSDEYNKTLSDKRANAVMKYLVDKGISKDRLAAKGHGESKPIATNDTDEGKSKNRRVEFHITKQDVTKKKVEIDPATGKERVIEETKSSENKK